MLSASFPMTSMAVVMLSGILLRIMVYSVMMLLAMASVIILNAIMQSVAVSYCHGEWR
jgi:hypothetical protein